MRSLFHTRSVSNEFQLMIELKMLILLVNITINNPKKSRTVRMNPVKKF